jgi:hypothetical protein
MCSNINSIKINYYDNPFFIIVFLFISGHILSQTEGAKFIDTHGYENCIELSNENVRVILEPNLGGRVLVYELNGKNMMQVSPENDGWIWDGDPENRYPNYGGPAGGRFDIGPEKTIPKRWDLYLGKWDAEITGPRSARLVSRKDTAVGIQLIRDFELDEKSSKLKFTQTMQNISETEKKYYHWMRTFAKGGGICLVPLSRFWRFPKGYILYGDNLTLMFDPPDEPAIRIRENILEIIDTPSRAKIGVDTEGDWTAYITQDDLLYIKKFNIYPEKSYGDLAGNPLSIWYYKNEKCEIEPTSPYEIIKPWEKTSYTEYWYLFDFKYPQDKNTDLKRMTELIHSLN